MPPRPTRDHYAVLRVPPTATAAEIKAAFRKRSFETHPDHSDAPDANRRMAELIEARDVLLDPAKRERFDRERGHASPRKPPTAWGEQRREEARTPPRRPSFRQPPPRGMGSIQPERMPDWYAFLGIRPTANAAEVLVALRRMDMQVRAAPYSPDVDQKLRQQIKDAGEMLANHEKRDLYDRVMLEGKAPKPGTHPRLHRDYYSFLGVRRGSRTLDSDIDDSAYALSEQLQKRAAEYAAFMEAWQTLRDPEKRAKYDAELDAAAAPAQA
ncbi:MAG: DnaJ domain-containing protein [Dehalococcoidia bacterium]|nr:DnaJ domain-containing protein [Dehalococcoidia bacterium]